MQETWVWALGWEALLEEEMAMHSSIIAWIILWTEEPGRLQSMGWQSFRNDWVTARAHTHTHIHTWYVLFFSVNMKSVYVPVWISGRKRSKWFQISGPGNSDWRRVKVTDHLTWASASSSVLPSAVPTQHTPPWEEVPWSWPFHRLGHKSHMPHRHLQWNSRAGTQWVVD